MKKITAVLIASLALISLVYGKTISLDDGNITFEAPDEFKVISEKVIKVKFPSSRRPKYVIGNKSATTTIAYDLKTNKIPQDKIDEVRKEFTQIFPRAIPNLKWKENKVINLSGRKWGYMEMTSSAVDTDIHNIILFTGYKDKMLIFNFNSTKKEFKKYKKALIKSIKSIKIK